MKAKTLMLDFIQHSFLLFIVGMTILYVLVGDRFDVIVQIMKSLVPLAIFAFFLLLMYRLKRGGSEEGFGDGDSQGEIILYLSYFDRIKSDIIIFLLPIIILLIPFINKEDITKIDIFQAGIAFLIIYSWDKFLFRKGRS